MRTDHRNENDDHDQGFNNSAKHYMKDSHTCKHSVNLSKAWSWSLPLLLGVLISGIIYFVQLFYAHISCLSVFELMYSCLNKMIPFSLVLTSCRDSRDCNSEKALLTAFET